MAADADFQLKQMIEILRDKIVKRGMDISCLDIGDVEHSGRRYFQVIKLKQGIETMWRKSSSRSSKMPRSKFRPPFRVMKSCDWQKRRFGSDGAGASGASWGNRSSLPLFRD